MLYTYVNAQDINLQLVEAAKNNDFEKIKELIKKGADINAYDENKATALYFAVKNKNYKTAKFLIGKSADINLIKTNGWGIVHYLAKNDKPEFLNYVLKKGANPNFVIVKSGSTPLMLAAKNNNLKCCFLLVNKGAYTDIKDKNEKTAFDIALKKNYYKIATYLKAPEKYKNISEIVSWQDLYDKKNKYYEAGNYIKALEFAKLAVEKAKEDFGSNDYTYALSCNDLAVNYGNFIYSAKSLNERLKLYKKAEFYYIEAQNTYGKIYGKNDTLYAVELNLR